MTPLLHKQKTADSDHECQRKGAGLLERLRARLQTLKESRQDLADATRNQRQGDE